MSIIHRPFTGTPQSKYAGKIQTGDYRLLLLLFFFSFFNWVVFQFKRFEVSYDILVKTTFLLGYLYLSSIFCHVHTGVGIARRAIEDPILGEDTDSYAVQINEHPNASCSNTRNRLQIKRTSKELTHANIGVLLNLDEHLLNLYLNGKNTRLLVTCNKVNSQ